MRAGKEGLVYDTTRPWPGASGCIAPCRTQACSVYSGHIALVHDEQPTAADLQAACREHDSRVRLFAFLALFEEMRMPTVTRKGRPLTVSLDPDALSLLRAMTPNQGLQALLEVNLRLATIDHLSNGYDVL
jgi:hypothetical protein